jgi:hypothetical protein
VSVAFNDCETPTRLPDTSCVLFSGRCSPCKALIYGLSLAAGPFVCPSEADAERQRK